MNRSQVEIQYISYDLASDHVRSVAGFLADHALAHNAGDCNDDGIPDDEQIHGDSSLDCNGNGILDGCEAGGDQDCNTNEVPDVCDIFYGTSEDFNGDAVPDECQVHHYVPSQYATIQAALNAAADGEFVVVADGTYTGPGNYQLRFHGRNICLRSQNGPDDCLIDCQQDGVGVEFSDAEKQGAQLAGFTITGGSDGGIECSDSSPTITDCTIAGNAGRGIYCFHGSPRITDCVITGNTADGDGGGVCCVVGSPRITGCTITGNTAGHDGGGVRCSVGIPRITGCAITGNTADDNGGGVYCIASNPRITDCTITGNTATYRGGGVWCDEGIPRITGCTLTGNAAGYQGGGVYCDDGSPWITNCILWADTPDEVYVSSSSPLITFCDVQDGWPGEGNIDADPLFVDPDGPDDDPNTWKDNDYRLAGGSPCVDAGDNTAVPADVADLDGDGDTDERTPVDLDGLPRFVDQPFVEDTGVADPPNYPAVVDMGAYEFRLGDINGDGGVDVFDLATLLGNYRTPSGMGYRDGDLDGDSAVDIHDLGALLAVYGTTY